MRHAARDAKRKAAGAAEQTRRTERINLCQELCVSYGEARAAIKGAVRHKDVAEVNSALETFFQKAVTIDYGD